VLTSLQQELNRIQLLISYILTRVRPMPAGKNRVLTRTNEFEACSHVLARLLLEQDSDWRTRISCPQCWT